MENRGQVYRQLHPKQAKNAYSPLESEVHIDVQVNRPTAEGRSDWTIRRAKIPGVLMIFSACLNLTGFVTIGMMHAFYSEFLIAFLIYSTTGILAIIGAVRVQTTQVVALGSLIMSCIALNLVGAQTLLRILDLKIGQPSQGLGWQNGTTSEKIVYGVQMTLLGNSFLTLAVCISLVVIGSKVVCLCCGGGDQGAEEARRDTAAVEGEYENQVPFCSMD